MNQIQESAVRKAIVAMEELQCLSIEHGGMQVRHRRELDAIQKKINLAFAKLSTAIAIAGMEEKP